MPQVISASEVAKDRLYGECRLSVKQAALCRLFCFWVTKSGAPDVECAPLL
jgi:hypothetical protein